MIWWCTLIRTREIREEDTILGLRCVARENPVVRHVQIIVRINRLQKEKKAIPARMIVSRGCPADALVADVLVKSVIACLVWVVWGARDVVWWAVVDVWVVVWVVVVALVVLKIPPEKTVEAYMRITGCPHAHAHTMLGIGGTSCIRLDTNGWRTHKHMRVYIRGFASRHAI